MTGPELITIEAIVSAPIETAWRVYTHPKYIVQWNQASPDWYCPAASNDLRPGGRFSSTMAARNGSMQFDFTGRYIAVDLHKHIAYVMDDGRTCDIRFEADADETRVRITFQAEAAHSLDLQRVGWQAILNSYAASAAAEAGKRH